MLRPLELTVRAGKYKCSLRVQACYAGLKPTRAQSVGRKGSETGLGMVEGDEETGEYRPYQAVGLVLGPVLTIAMLIFPPPEGLSAAGWSTAAVATLMAVWWATQAVPLGVTALLPLVLLPVLGISGITEAAAPFANPLIFLFLGGFLIALAVERWGLHRRMALHIVDRVGGRPLNLVAGIMLATAGLSMWISNTATTIMMLPIATSLIAVTGARAGGGTRGGRNFAAALMLGTAYAASIGGMATLIGSPPNALVAGYLLQNAGVEVTFVGWMIVALPITIVMLPLAWLLLTRLVFPFHNRDVADQTDAIPAMLAAMGPMSKPEKRVALVFAAVALGWILHPLISDVLGVKVITDVGVAIAGAVLLFAIPADWKAGTFLLEWETARRVPWEILLLFGGGLSLASAIDGSGLAIWLGSGLDFLYGAPPVLIVAGVALFTVFMTELVSNTATTAALLPVVTALTGSTELTPLVLAMSLALAASSAYMLPVATPPNAIVFGSGRVSLPQMMRAGVLLGLAGVVVITAGVMLLAPM
jgi:solute carrier family 13 (sodium-dependent dicarboxylate transporter), member 2/3/5